MELKQTKNSFKLNNSFDRGTSSSNFQAFLTTPSHESTGETPRWTHDTNEERQQEGDERRFRREEKSLLQIIDYREAVKKNKNKFKTAVYKAHIRTTVEICL